MFQFLCVGNHAFDHQEDEQACDQVTERPGGSQGQAGGCRKAGEFVNALSVYYVMTLKLP